MTEVTLEIEVQWGDCDPAGIVFYPNYFSWFNRATWQLFARAGVPIDRLLRDKRCAGVPLTKAEAQFSAPSRPGDVLRLDSRIHRIEGTRIHIRHQARRGDIPVLTGGETRAWAVVRRSVPLACAVLRCRPISWRAYARRQPQRAEPVV